MPECARSLWKGRNPQIKNRLCKPDAARQAKTRETDRTHHDFMPSVCQGQRGDQRLPETAETRVVRLITQRTAGTGIRNPANPAHYGVSLSLLTAEPM